jgi:hypothetical protein
MFLSLLGWRWLFSGFRVAGKLVSEMETVFRVVREAYL